MDNVDIVLLGRALCQLISSSLCHVEQRSRSLTGLRKLSGGIEGVTDKGKRS